MSQSESIINESSPNHEVEALANRAEQWIALYSPALLGRLPLIGVTREPYGMMALSPAFSGLARDMAHLTITQSPVVTDLFEDDIKHMGESALELIIAFKNPTEIRDQKDQITLPTQEKNQTLEELSRKQGNTVQTFILVRADALNLSNQIDKVPLDKKDIVDNLQRLNLLIMILGNDGEFIDNGSFAFECVRTEVKDDSGKTITITNYIPSGSNEINKVSLEQKQAEILLLLTAALVKQQRGQEEGTRLGKK